MKLVTYKDEGKEKIGVVSEDELYIYPAEIFGVKAKDMKELIASREDQEILKRETAKIHGQRDSAFLCQSRVKLEAGILEAPIPEPAQDMICLGINYMEHAEESARFKLETFDGKRTDTVYFSKRVNRAVPCGAPIPLHKDITDSLDYETELAFIIGKDAKNVAREDAAEYIFGYTIINDVSARDIQNRHKQWYFGKSLDGSTPMGPWIVTADEIEFPPRLSVETRVNGQLRQKSSTQCMIFGIDYVISQLSRGMTLKAGTIIATGTPSGVGMGLVPPVFLKQGDEIVCRIEKIGTLYNRVE